MRSTCSSPRGRGGIAPATRGERAGGRQWADIYLKEGILRGCGSLCGLAMLAWRLLLCRLAAGSSWFEVGAVRICIYGRHSIYIDSAN